MKTLPMFAAYWLQIFAAILCVPVMRLTGLRFSKAWRGNPIVHHVAANLWADFQPVGIAKFYNRFF